jgi:PTH1 family peptidyl-tRNA hydrolase
MKNQLKAIAGLGNPEDRYERTLHNAGFWFVDAVARRFGGSFRYEKKFDAELAKTRIGGEDVWLIKPQSYMNLSGGPVRGVIDYYRIGVGDLLVAHDEIDLPPGKVRLKVGGGHGGHNGIRDVAKHCGPNFVRLRLGVGHPGEKDKVSGYVLKKGSADVEAAIERNIDDAMRALETWVDSDLNAAMKKLHTQSDNQ